MEDNLDAGFCQESVCCESFGDDLNLHEVAKNNGLNAHKTEQPLNAEVCANKAEFF